MVKGTTRQVIVVKSPDPRLFEQAIFLLKEDALEAHGVGERELLEEAQRVASGGAGTVSSLRQRVRHFLWAGAGAAAVGLVWLGSSLFF